jgi:hypothetical protein
MTEGPWWACSHPSLRERCVGLRTTTETPGYCPYLLTHEERLAEPGLLTAVTVTAFKED